MKSLIILFALLLSFTSSANTEITNETTDKSVAVESTIVYDKRKRQRKRFNRKHGVKKSKCLKQYRIKVR